MDTLPELPDGFHWDANLTGESWGIRRQHDGKLMAFAKAAQLTELESLPARGWSFAIEHEARRRHPNTLCLLVANVEPEARGLGLSSRLLERAKLTARKSGLQSILARNDVAEETGDVCAEFVEIRASLPKWREWTDLTLEVDEPRNVGTYRERGVWVKYGL